MNPAGRPLAAAARAGSLAFGHATTPITGVPELAAARDSEIPRVAAWLRCEVEDLEIALVRVPGAAIRETAAALRATYRDFPQEARRTSRIVRALRRGEQAWPLFVDAGDCDGFILEGRHRVVAFDKVGLDPVPVAYVRTRTS